MHRSGAQPGLEPAPVLPALDSLPAGGGWSLSPEGTEYPASSAAPRSEAHPGAVVEQERTSPARPVDGGDPDASRRLLVVPRTPGRLIDLGTGEGRSRDELDQFIDDVFGQTTEERPGPFDVLLLVGGLILLSWGLLLGGPALASWLGVVAVLLGIALPVRSAVRRFGERRSRAARRRIIGDGMVLDVSDPAAADLARAYDGLLDAAHLPNIREPGRIRAAGHLAVIEVASLLKGAPPLATEQVVYVGRRTKAIRDLTSDLLQSHERWLATTRAAMEARASEGRAWAAAVTTAREELESTLRTGSLSELDSLRIEVQEGLEGTDA